MKPVLQLHQKEDGKKGAMFCSLVAAPQVTFDYLLTTSPLTFCCSTANFSIADGDLNGSLRKRFAASFVVLQYFDAICQELLQATDNEKRYAADKALSEFCKRPEVFANIHPLLERTDVYGRVFLAAALKVVISRSGVVPVEQRLQLLGFLLNYLFSRQCAERLVLKSLIDLDQSCLIGRQLKVAASFRDTYLLDIYKVSIGLLKSVAENVISFNVEDADQALNCLVQVASIRRTLFDCKKRSEMLLEMMESIIEMLSSSRVPSAPESSHQFCLLLVA
ncbi:hypothetical protein M513_13039 [Trichuris suis]|uniref:Uncharacterized protein n=2 Tax=Trichuris suis TaxID=68888 RepID=A0A085LM76_9BILA|nr:hypothetical protein M513_13039 [Trichuris suis]